MKFVLICSPYSGDIEHNTARVKGYCRFAYIEGSIPYAPHLHNTQFLKEEIPKEREAGIVLGLEILQRADELWCFGDRVGVGMATEIKLHSN